MRALPVRRWLDHSSMGLDDSPVSYIRVREPLMATQFQAHSSVLVSPLRLWEGAMRRHSKGRELAKARRRKVAPPKAAHRRRSFATGQGAKIARLIRERDEALQQQAATA